MAELGMTEGFDVGLEMSGAPPRVPHNARHHEPRRPHCDAGYSSVGYVHRLDEKLSLRGCLLKVSMAGEMFETWYKMAALIQSGLDLSPIITHRLRH
ncbi:L-threonine 3-dehydrogenase [Kluyvera cryocrescens]|uniref:L-threonine 3-dehydrogenase n=1 Tax=Kluyvera cryocrescens TaxID=580 RepID=A0A485AYQ7_KLUCR|nr:L-threonine 3-dehydrogenase [Kluyvera cryocrescens]